MNHVKYYFLRLALTWDLITPIRQSDLRDIRTAFLFRQWLGVCAMKIGASYSDDLFSKYQHVLGGMYSLGLKSFTHNHSTHAGPVKAMTSMLERKWKGSPSIPKHHELFKWTLNISVIFNLRVKRLTYWSTISLRWCPETAAHICYLFNLKRKHPLSPSPGACSASLALVSIHWGWSAATVWWGQEQLLGMSGSCAQKHSVKSCDLNISYHGLYNQDWQAIDVW